MTNGDPILTVAQMRAAEQALIDGGETVSTLMEAAGKGAAAWVRRMVAGRSVTVLCGPGNNGGDGYVIARKLLEGGLDVTVIAPLEPATEAARVARAAWTGPFDAGGHRGVLVDCLFGSGLTRPLSPELAALLADLAGGHDFRIAIDLPSGIDADRGVALNEDLPRYDLTLALGAWKFAHWLMPAAAAMGERRLAPIGVGAPDDAAHVLQRPRLKPPAVDAHKYSRGLVLVVAGAMPGAALLASGAALRSGAGALRLAADRVHPATPPDLIVRDEPLADLLADKRAGAVVVGPGLGRDQAARRRLGDVLAAGLPTVVDADALRLLAPDSVAAFMAPMILTPHQGEMDALVRTFRIDAEGKVERARALARASGAVIVAKGPDTVIVAPDGRTVIAPPATPWLSTGGAGDVLAGISAARLAWGGDAFVAACEAVWLHGEAARLADVGFTASHLVHKVSAAYAAAL